LPAGRALSRTALDAALVAAAVAEGADHLPETQASVTDVDSGTRRVLLSHLGRTLTAKGRVVLVAAGLGQTCLAREPTIRTRTDARSRLGAGCVIEEFPAFFQERTIYMAVGRHGYVGLVRLEDGLLNVAAAFDKGFVKDCGGPGRAACQLLDEAEFPSIRALPCAPWQGTVQLTRRTFPLAGERLFLLGDAAGYVEPFTGEGIAWALISAQAIEPLVRQGIERWEPSLQRAWPALHRQVVGRRQRLCHALALLSHHPWLARNAFELLSRLPSMTRRMINHVNAPSILSPASSL
jgi:menaquinone-9 beta-reductase